MRAVSGEPHHFQTLSGREAGPGTGVGLSQVEILALHLAGTSPVADPLNVQWVFHLVMQNVTYRALEREVVSG
ncbi:hypothetical protein HY857_00580 [Candidatus Saccharibacteria bacterium]|nr:hypothetical protein [Candidatus Saccharibacteria bacterium]